MQSEAIPDKAKIEVEKVPMLDGVENLASNDEVAKNTVLAIADYEYRFDTDRAPWSEDIDGLWNQMDAAFKAFINNQSVEIQRKYGANTRENEERSRLGTTQFHRQVAQKASMGYSYQTSKELPFKYVPVRETDDDLAEDRAEKMNLLAKWTMKKDRFDLKSIDFWWQVRKYGNVPVMVEWMTRTDDVETRVPIIGDDGEIEGYEFKVDSTIVENRPVFSILPIDSVKADPFIGNIQDQECVIVTSVVGLSAIVDGIRNGYYREDLLEDLNRSHQWDGSSGKTSQKQKKDNSGLSELGNSSASGQYLKREVFINIPVFEGKWDEQSHIPQRYRVTLFGNDPASSVVARIERNTEPGDIIPIEMIHAEPDDPDFLYHTGDYEVIRSNMSTENTLIRQVIDNGALVNKNVTWEVMGEVQGGVSGANDREWKSGQRFILSSPNSMGQFPIRDISQSALGVLEYIKDDSNTALGIDRNMTGKSYGARTSASEVSTISDSTKRPNMVSIEYVMEQLLGFVAQRYAAGWKAYGLPSQVVRILGKDDKEIKIRPAEIDGEFDIVVDILDDVKSSAVEVNRLMNYAQTMGSVPGFAQTTDWAKLNKALAEKMLGTDEFVTGDNTGDAVANAKLNLFNMFNNDLPDEDRYPELDPSMDLATHLRLYQQERIRWRGSEDRNPEGIAILDQTIEQLKHALSQQGRQQAQPQQQLPQEAGEQARQEISGAMGGLNAPA